MENRHGTEAGEAAPRRGGRPGTAILWGGSVLLAVGLGWAARGWLGLPAPPDTGAAPLVLHALEPAPASRHELLPWAYDVAPENTLAVPGLPVLTVEWEDGVMGERGLYLRQLLPTGDTLELRYFGLLVTSAAPPERLRGLLAPPERPPRPLSPKVLEASLPPGWNQVSVRWGRGWVVARAPLPPASLRALVRTLF